MEKVLTRTRLAVNQAKRRGRLRNEKVLKKQRHMYKAEVASHGQKTRYPSLLERKTRREDWELGPIAPWRDATATQELFATFPQDHGAPPKKPEAWRLRDSFIRRGDRVCIVKGPATIKGTIGKVEKVSKDNYTVEIQDVNSIESRIPRALRTEERAGATTSRPQPVPISHVQLVYPLPDPNTGIPRDCLLTNLEKRDEYFNRYTRRMEWYRYLMPQNIKIPWPEEDVPQHYEELGDTVRLDLEDTTFVPTLLTPPMPESVIDELRNKTSRFRVRHDEEYIRKKTQEDAESKKLKEIRQALLPRGAKNMARRPSTTRVDWDSIMEGIGQHMAKKGLKVPGDGKASSQEPLR